MCALPSAQLGSMSSLNVPSFVPTVQVQKEPKAWEKALLAILTQAGATVLTTGVGNAMSNDNAAEFGGTPRSGFGKLLAPKVSDAEAGRRRSEDTALQMGNARLDTERAMQDKNIYAQQSRDIMQGTEAEMGRQEQGTIGRSLEKLRSENDLSREGTRAANEQELARLRASLEAADPYRVEATRNMEENRGIARGKAASDAEYDKARAEEQRAKAAGENKRNALIPEPTPTAAKSGVNPNVAKFAATASPAPAAATGLDRVRALLAEGRSPEEVVALMKQETARTADTRTAEQAAAQSKLDIEREILRRLIPSDNGFTFPTM